MVRVQRRLAERGGEARRGTGDPGGFAGDASRRREAAEKLRNPRRLLHRTASLGLARWPRASGEAAREAHGGDFPLRGEDLSRCRRASGFRWAPAGGCSASDDELPWAEFCGAVWTRSGATDSNDLARKPAERNRAKLRANPRSACERLRQRAGGPRGPIQFVHAVAPNLKGGDVRALCARPGLEVKRVRGSHV